MSLPPFHYHKRFGYLQSFLHSLLKSLKMPILLGISDFSSMLVVGLEPTRGCPQQILSLPRLPFRHTSIPTTELYDIITAIGWQVISAKNTF